MNDYKPPLERVPDEFRKTKAAHFGKDWDREYRVGDCGTVSLQ